MNSESGLLGGVLRSLGRMLFGRQTLTIAAIMIIMLTSFGYLHGVAARGTGTSPALDVDDQMQEMDFAECRDTAQDKMIETVDGYLPGNLHKTCAEKETNPDPRVVGFLKFTVRGALSYTNTVSLFSYNYLPAVPGWAVKGWSNMAVITTLFVGYKPYITRLRQSYQEASA